MGEKEYQVSKGSLFIINYDTPHKFVVSPESESPMAVYNCIFTPDFLDMSLINCKDFSAAANQFLLRSFFSEEHEVPSEIYLIHHDSPTIEDLYKKMYMEYTQGERGYIQIVRAYIIELLVIFFRLFYKTNFHMDKGKAQNSKVIDKVMYFIKNNYWKEMKLEELSMMAFFSPSHFFRQFKQYTGMTVSEYTQKVRVEEACSLLKNTDRKIIDIASEVGYSDMKYFSQVFKSITGATPGQYRKEAHK